MPNMFESISAWADGMWDWVVIILFLALAAWETLRPARQPALAAAPRWFANIGLLVFNNFVLTVLLPGAIANSLTAHFDLPPRVFDLLDHAAGNGPVLIAGLLTLDLYAYSMHRLQHRVFFLWRFHAVHHADTDMDASTTFRHHPVDTLISAGISTIVFSVLGVPEWVFPIYALGAIITSLVQHVNAGQSGRIDGAFRWVLVTPGLHQIHHSVAAADHDANYGTVFSFWDRIFGSYRENPVGGRSAMAFGVAPFTTAEFARPRWALMLPLAVTRSAEPAVVSGHAD